MGKGQCSRLLRAALKYVSLGDDFQDFGEDVAGCPEKWNLPGKH